MGDLRDRDFTSYYKDFLSIKIGAKEQRSIFEANLPQYINKGVEQLKEKNIIPKNVYAAFSKAQ
jgi:hypothetical protein